MTMALPDASQTWPPPSHNELAQRYGLQVERMDEGYSSTEAGSLLREQRASGQRRKAVRKGDVDSAAAAIILESWLGAQVT